MLSLVYKLSKQGLPPVRNGKELHRTEARGDAALKWIRDHRQLVVERFSGAFVGEEFRFTAYYYA